MESVKNGDLPEDVVLEILLRLPVKTLLQLKCVCKRWYALIGSSSFVNQHFSQESNQEHLLIRHYRPDEERYAFALYVDEIFSGYEEPDHLQMPLTVAALMGPLNGVFCVVSISGHMALLNPAMRQFKPLPLVHPYVHPHLSSYDDLLGFGLDLLVEITSLFQFSTFGTKKWMSRTTLLLFQFTTRVVIPGDTLRMWIWLIQVAVHIDLCAIHT
ncbi:UNVERIFIED_CONTAM: F-box protein [Sesamum angustifolium]|uniref:F-box protein n=1 Tax=Sesamum angustifolium TaxID=2727405 RepID=A0AAW2NJE1_9LAMI